MFSSVQNPNLGFLNLKDRKSRKQFLEISILSKNEWKTKKNILRALKKVFSHFSFIFWKKWEFQKMLRDLLTFINFFHDIFLLFFQGWFKKKQLFKLALNIGIFLQLNAEIWLAGLTYSGSPATNAAHWMANLIEMCKLAKNCR